MDQSFEEKVRSMSSYEIIMAMVNGLKEPITKIRMASYGHIDGDTCYGCAATNAIAKITGIEKLVPRKPPEFGWEPKAVKASSDFILKFEKAINYLREGNIFLYNACISDINEQAKIKLPIGNEKLLIYFFSNEGRLGTATYLERLPMYQWLSQLQLHAATVNYV